MVLVLPVIGATRFDTLVKFNGTNGFYPQAGLIAGKDGELYGTTPVGAMGFNGAGEIFKVSKNGKFQILQGFNYTNGFAPSAKLIQGQNGELYGTTAGDGTHNYGTVFAYSEKGIKIIGSFSGTNGSVPRDIVRAADGALYGIAQFSGEQIYTGNGLLFRLSTNGEIDDLFRFNGTNGSTPSSFLQARDGNFYGTTKYGGMSFNPDTSNGYGTVFRLSTNGEFTTLFNFDETNGSVPMSLVEGNDGSLYGTTFSGGENGSGTVFRITTNGAFTILHSFGDPWIQNTDGAYPWGNLLFANDGCLYGGTTAGGDSVEGYYLGTGTLFRITTNGIFKTLFLFGNASDSSFAGGTYPNGLIQDNRGNFYGTTGRGGRATAGSDYGTVFKLFFVRPVLRINSPHRNAQIAGNGVAVKGNAKGKDEVVDVFYQVNESEWMEATTTNSWKDWTASALLMPGTNTFRAYAVEADGVTSRTNVLKLRSDSSGVPIAGP